MEKNLPQPPHVSPKIVHAPFIPPPSRLSSGSPKSLTPDAVENILENPHTLLQMKFLHEANTEDSRTWQVESYMAKRSGEVICHIQFEDGDDTVPHDLDGMRTLLLGSHTVV